VTSKISPGMPAGICVYVPVSPPMRTRRWMHQLVSVQSALHDSIYRCNWPKVDLSR
jgi:hypothetical protein